MKKGNFQINFHRWGQSGYHCTTDDMYDCVDCLAAGKEHSIIGKEGAPAKGNEFSLKGDTTTIRECTCCHKQDGPWVKCY